MLGCWGRGRNNRLAKSGMWEGKAMASVRFPRNMLSRLCVRFDSNVYFSGAASVGSTWAARSGMGNRAPVRRRLCIRVRVDIYNVFSFCPVCPPHLRALLACQ